MENNSWYTDHYNPCENCPYWDNRCTADECQMNDGGADNG